MIGALSISPPNFMATTPASLNGSSARASRDATELRGVFTEHTERARRWAQCYAGGAADRPGARPAAGAHIRPRARRAFHV